MAWHVALVYQVSLSTCHYHTPTLPLWKTVCFIFFPPPISTPLSMLVSPPGSIFLYWLENSYFYFKTPRYHPSLKPSLSPFKQNQVGPPLCSYGNSYRTSKQEYFFETLVLSMSLLFFSITSSARLSLHPSCPGFTPHLDCCKNIFMEFSVPGLSQ